MKNYVNANFITWLNRFHATVQDQEIKQAVIFLSKEISAINSIEKLIQLFADYLEYQPDPNGPLLLYTQVHSWKSLLEKIMRDHQKAVTALNQLETTVKNKALITLLKEILDDPKLLLHNQMTCLLPVLCNDRFHRLIPYIIDLPKIPLPSMSSKDSFFAQKPLSPQHAACFALLNNLSAAQDSQSAYWKNANNLLLSALLIYPELEMVEISLEETLEHPPKEISVPNTTIYQDIKNAFSASLRRTL